ncbi:expressed unknown protein [Seminavis robusta]|uniref:Uncharacterized protein n=1 Tax=Seminavis robusta TaxID=568900 RepID=A0A9N8HAN3_9STRA|nr:expressed unknown protein [Seminavis robusta]|eukprot:Sro248_g098250.1 n/a (156) ;mRNA; r:13702-14169
MTTVRIVSVCFTFFLLSVATAAAFSPTSRAFAVRQSTNPSSSRLFFGLGTIEKQEEQYLELAFNNANSVIPEAVYVIVYNPGAENEGVHTTEWPRGGGQYILMAFESPFECQHFAEMIAVGYPGWDDPVPTQYTAEQVQEYCQQMGWNLQLVPEF